MIKILKKVNKIISCTKNLILALRYLNIITVCYILGLTIFSFGISPVVYLVHLYSVEGLTPVIVHVILVVIMLIKAEKDLYKLHCVSLFKNKSGK